MAADVIKLRSIENGSTKELTVYNPETNLLWAEATDTGLDLIVGVSGNQPMQIQFGSQLSRDQAVQDLTDSMGTSGTGVVYIPATTTTTSTTSTTTTTTEPPLP
jgi:hypothetical protein